MRLRSSYDAMSARATLLRFCSTVTCWLLSSCTDSPDNVSEIQFTFPCTNSSHAVWTVVSTAKGITPNAVAFDDPLSACERVYRTLTETVNDYATRKTIRLKNRHTFSSRINRSVSVRISSVLFRTWLSMKAFHTKSASRLALYSNLK